MDVPCPKCTSTDLEKVSLVNEERLYQSDKRAQFRCVLIGGRGQGVLVGISTTKGTKRRGSPHKAVGVDLSNLQEYFSALVVPRNIRRSNLRRDESFQNLLVARQQNRVAGGTFRAQS